MKTDLGKSIHDYLAQERSAVRTPANLHARIMQGLGTRIAPQRPARGRQLAMTLAIVIFVGAVGLGFSKLREVSQRGVTNTRPTSSATSVPTTPVPLIPHPPARFGAAMAFDRAHGRSIMFGGQGADGHYLGDTWSWDGSGWTELHPSSSPSPRVSTRLSYDEARGVILLYGGTGQAGPSSIGPLSDLWSWNGVTWTELRPRHIPPQRAGSSFAYDPQVRAAVLFGGDAGERAPALKNDMWLWNGSDWTEVPLTKSPSPRADASMVFDLSSNALLLFGGTSGVPLNDTWTWDGRIWTQLHPARSPVARHSAIIAYDAAASSVILFGGEGGDANKGPVAALSDTWAWNGVMWVEKRGGGPSARWMASASYDEVRHVVVLFGGPAGNKTGLPLADTWARDDNGWRQLGA